MKRVATTIIVLGLLVPMSIAIVGYCLEPDSGGFETIVLGAVLLGSSLIVTLLLKAKSDNNP